MIYTGREFRFFPGLLDIQMFGIKYPRAIRNSELCRMEKHHERQIMKDKS